MGKRRKKEIRPGEEKGVKLGFRFLLQKTYDKL